MRQNRHVEANPEFLSPAPSRLTTWHGLLAALAAVLLAGWAGYTAGLEIRRANLSNQLAGYSDLHARLIPTELGRYDMLSYATQAPTLDDVLADPDNRSAIDRARQFLHKLAVDSNSASALLADQDGRIVAANDDEFIGVDVSFRPYFRNAVAGHHDRFIAVAVFSGELGYFVSQPLTNAAGKVAGVLVIKRALTQEDYFTGADSDRFVSFLTDNHGVVFLSEVAAWNFSTLEPLSQAQRQEIRRHRQYDNQPLETLDWQVRENLGERQSIVRLSLPDGRGRDRDLLLHSQPIPELGWEIHTLAELSDVKLQAGLYAFGAGGAATIAVLLAFAFIQRERYRRALLQQAIRDPLTGLYTRLFMREHVLHIFGAHDRGEFANVALILIDLDRFKDINDTRGHNFGDQVLKQVADVLHHSKRQSDVAVRYGGEEFALFCPETSATQARALAERIRRRVEETRFEVKGQAVAVTLSAGVASRTREQSLDDLVEAADRRLYEAKDGGRNRIC